MGVQFRRVHLWYAGAAVVGFMSVPVLSWTNPVQFLVGYLIELVFVLSGIGVLYTVYSLLREDFSSITIWTGIKIIGLLLLIPFTFASGSLLYESQTAWKGDEVHWHADFAVVVDGTSHELIDPDAFCGDDYFCKISDYTGPSDFHEHNDMRIHRHGPIPEYESATLSAFFDGLNGKLTNTELRFPTNDGWVNVTEGDGKTLKILVSQRTHPYNGWCAVGDAPAGHQCVDPHTEQRAAGPGEYVLSPYKEGPTDRIFITYDETSVDAALEDVRADGRYRGVAAE